ncbi:amino acid ABC transporter permease [Terrabacter aerolatus]|uniref:amino acid ABC transporter permease n=1 Tax=Terrabacter aerolatus TaxID=422442 RepID=UPI0011BD8163|nr:amino acid ABC transporter permease [Terrabacter aerolatus]
MTDQSTTERPGLIDARPVRHPWRWVAVAVILVMIAMIISSFLTNDRWDFSLAGQIMIQQPVIDGLLKGTILGTVGSMVIGVVLGIVIAVMRISSNPVLRGVSFVYTWFFRAIPRYVLLVIIGSGIGYLYNTLDIGVPFGQQIASLLGLSSDLTIGSLNVNGITGSIVGGIIGLGLSEAAYMAEIARSGILSVDPGQREAAQALGMSNGKLMRRIVLPQAMRVIVPPTGNETIAMVKDTSLLIAIPVIAELNYQTGAIANRIFKIMPGLVASTAWYLIICSILMVGQFYLERYFGRGFGQQRPKTRRFARPAGAGGA